MRKLFALTVLGVVAACSAEHPVAPQPTSTPALAQCQQSSTGCARPMLIIDGQVSEYTLLDLRGEDIESVAVIKGAAAMKVYGADARNGVIIITTKRRD